MLCPACKTVNDAVAANCASCGRPLRLDIGTVLANRYDIQAVLGQGGMGTVYRAYDKVLEETVAIKVLRPEMIADEDMARRFLAEIKTARKIAHRNVCRIHEYGEDHGLRFISMAYVEGVDLKKILKDGGPLPWPEAFEVAIRVAEALGAIHDEGIVHRDLKTPNIMRDHKGVVRVMDFGIAKDQAVGGMTQTGMIMGTPEYMSPEQATGVAIDFRSDLYALGVVVFELFTANLPFRSETPMGTLMKQIQEPPPLDGPAAVGIPEAVLPVLARLLAKDPAQRYGSTEEVVEALKHARSVSVAGAAATPAGLPAVTGGYASAGNATAVSNPTRGSVAPPVSPTPPPLPTPGPAPAPAAVPPPAPAWTAPAATARPAPAPSGGGRTKMLLIGGAAVLGLGFIGFLLVVFLLLGSVPDEPAQVAGTGPGVTMATPGPDAPPASTPVDPATTGEPAAAPTAPPATEANPVAPPPPGPASTADGVLEVLVTPTDARVTVDGTIVRRGLIELPPGPYTLRIEHPRFEPLERPVNIAGGGMARVSVDLEREGVRRAAAAPAEPAEEPSGAEWLVAHDHGAGFSNFCVGTLSLQGNTVAFRSGEHDFRVGVAQLKEAKRNDLYGANFLAFHIKLKSGQNYNLAYVTRTGQPLDPMPILTSFRVAGVR